MIVQKPKKFNGILVCGEAPGAEEQRLRRPFVGPEGQYLRTKFKKAGINFASCFVTNTVHRQPFKNKYETLTQEDLDYGRLILIEAINEYKPNLIIAVGAKALSMLCNKTSITKVRGSVTPCELVPGYKVLPIIHPGMIFRTNPAYDILISMDLRKATQEAKFPEIRYPERNIQTIYTASEAIKLLERLSKDTKPHAIDIETAGPRLLVYGIATSPTTSFVIPKNLCQDREVLRAISRYADSNVPKIFHNALYDVFYCAYFYQIYHRNVYYDTMIAQHAIFPTLQKSLAFCASIYTNEVYWKDEGKEIFDDIRKNRIIDWEQFYIYNGKDTCLTYEVFEAQQEELDYWKVHEINDLMHAVIQPCLYAMLKGLRINMEKVKIFAKNNERALEVLDRIKKATIGDINLLSSKQLKELLYEKWKMPVQKVKGRVSTDAKSLQHLEAFPTPYKPLIGLILKYKEHRTLRNFYTISLCDDGYVRYTIKITGAYTGRMSSSKSIIEDRSGKKVGYNFQNQPAAVRHFYDADPGKIMVEADLSNAEARIVAACCQDEDWLQRFDVQDQHRFVASELFNVPYEQVTKEQRNKYAKRVAHASHYMFGWRALSMWLMCSAKEAKAFKQRYFEIRPKLAEWHARVDREVRRTRMIRTCFGRVIQFFGPHFDRILPAAVAAEPQSTSVDYIDTAIVKCFQQIPEYDFRLQVHDSMLFQLPDDLACIETVLPKVKELTEQPICVHGLTFKIPLDFKIGYNWGNMYECTLDTIADAYEKARNETLQISGTL